MEDEPQPYDPRPSAVAAAQAELEVARRSGRSGAIALAQFNLAAVLALAEDHLSAVAQYRELIDYLDLASGDGEAEQQRMLRMVSPAAPPPDATDVDPVQLQAFARVELARSLLALGRRDEAARELEAASGAARGFGRGGLRRRIKDVQARMTAATAARHPSADPARRARAQPMGPAEEVAAADELLGEGRHQEAARLALGAIAKCADDQVLIRARARQVLGMALEGMDRTDDAYTVLRDSYSDYLLADQHDAAANVAVALAWRRADAGDRAGAADLLRGALDAIGGSAGPAVRVRLLVDLGSLQDQDGRREDALRTFGAAVESARSSGDGELLADAQHGLAIVLATSSAGADDAVEALTLLDDCRRRYQGAGLADRAAGCEHEAAALLGRLGSYDAAAARYRRAIERYRELPAEQRDTGSWPDELADCEHNLRAVAAAVPAAAGGDGSGGARSGGAAALADDPSLFRSGGHAMSHARN